MDPSFINSPLSLRQVEIIKSAGERLLTRLAKPTPELIEKLVNIKSTGGRPLTRLARPAPDLPEESLWRKMRTTIGIERCRKVIQQEGLPNDPILINSKAVVLCHEFIDNAISTLSHQIKNEVSEEFHKILMNALRIKFISELGINTSPIDDIDTATVNDSSDVNMSTVNSLCVALKTKIMENLKKEELENVAWKPRVQPSPHHLNIITSYADLLVCLSIVAAYDAAKTLPCVINSSNDRKLSHMFGTITLYIFNSITSGEKLPKRGGIENHIIVTSILEIISQKRRDHDKASMDLIFCQYTKTEDHMIRFLESMSEEQIREIETQAARHFDRESFLVPIKNDHATSAIHIECIQDIINKTITTLFTWNNKEIKSILSDPKYNWIRDENPSIKSMAHLLVYAVIIGGHTAMQIVSSLQNSGHYDRDFNPISEEHSQIVGYTMYNLFLYVCARDNGISKDELKRISQHSVIKSVVSIIGSEIIKINKLEDRNQNYRLSIDHFFRQIKSEDIEKMKGEIAWDLERPTLLLDQHQEREGYSKFAVQQSIKQWKHYTRLRRENPIRDEIDEMERSRRRSGITSRIIQQMRRLFNRQLPTIDPTTNTENHDHNTTHLRPPRDSYDIPSQRTLLPGYDEHPHNNPPAYDPPAYTHISHHAITPISPNLHVGSNLDTEERQERAGSWLNSLTEQRRASTGTNHESTELTSASVQSCSRL